MPHLAAVALGVPQSLPTASRASTPRYRLRVRSSQESVEMLIHRAGRGLGRCNVVVARVHRLASSGDTTKERKQVLDAIHSFGRICHGVIF